jgi:F-type H+-transporting ATPase subunit delta
MTSQSATEGSAREKVFDVKVERLARVYAQAALDAAGDGRDEVMDELRSLVADVLNKFPGLDEIFDSALISIDEKLAMLDRLFARQPSGQLSATTLNFLKVLTKHGRLGCLRDVVRSAEALWSDRNSRVQLELQLAHQLDDKLHEELIASLRDTLGIDPIVTTRIDADLIGGFVVRVGDKVYDASARTQLEKTRQAIIEQAVENIQSRPDLFKQT